MTETGRDHLKRANVVFLALFLFGAWIRSLDVWRPVDGRVRESWRECDYAAVARNFYREGMNILYPRIDWRGDGPGYAEMEFPVIPWTMAALYKIFGYQEVLGRVLIYAFSLLTLELRTLIPRTTGEDLIGFGEKMFAFYEAKAAEVKNIDLGQWSSFPSEHFVFFAHAGSAAAGEMDFVRKVAEETYVEIVRSLDIEQEVENRLPFVSTEVQIKGKKEEGAESHPGKIAVFLHHLRSEASAKKIGKHSMGSMTFGAKILHSEDEKGQGRLKVQIDILYFNALSVIVLSHEIAHAALFLGSFNTEPLVRNPLKGYFALRKAFSAGYLSISPFLQEGIGDYVIYFRGFYRNWPLLPEPEILIQGFQKSGRYVPLRKIITGGFPAYQRKRKECSLEAASFINFLMREFGTAKLKAWFLSGKKETSKAFEKIFEMPPEQMEKKWLDFIQPI